MFSDDSPETMVDLLLSHRPDGIIFTTMGLRQVPVPAKLLTLPEKHLATLRRRQGLECDCLEANVDPDTLDHVYMQFSYPDMLAQGLRIPQDVAVMGYDNMVGIGDLFFPPLSTVQLPHYDIGRLSALHIINQETHSDTIRVESPLLLRESL